MNQPSSNLRIKLSDQVYCHMKIYCDYPGPPSINDPKKLSQYELFQHNNNQYLWCNITVRIFLPTRIPILTRSPTEDVIIYGHSNRKELSFLSEQDFTSSPLYLEMLHEAKSDLEHKVTQVIECAFLYSSPLIDPTRQVQVITDLFNHSICSQVHHE